jgi:hypothetical protein
LNLDRPSRGSEVIEGGEDIGVEGCIIATNHTVFMWRDNEEGGGEDNLATRVSFWKPFVTLCRLQPSAVDGGAELVILGLPSTALKKERLGGVPESVMKELRGIEGLGSVEVMERGRAIALFNIMNGEGRGVIAGLLDWTEEEEV